MTPTPAAPIILILVADFTHQQQLQTFLAPKYTLTLGADASALDRPFDLCILDGPRLTALEDRILFRKSEDLPFLPFLLVTSREDLPALAGHIQFTVDEILLTPIVDLILKPRVETLLNTRRLVKEVQLLADFDELTGALTRRRFFRRAQREFARALRFQRPLSAIMLDLDFFKDVNDTHGHPIGDQVLRAVSYCCQEHIREIDIFGRFGGDEFALVLPELDLLSAHHIADRLRRAIAQQSFHTSAGPLQITLSMGLAAITPTTADIDTLLLQADQALYHAKQSGRNRVSVGAEQG